MATVLETVAATLLQAGLKPGAHLLLGYSGGLDSTVLLHALARLRERFSFVLEAHHVHHGLSPDADDWAEHCTRVCRGLDVPFTVTRVSVDCSAGQGIEAAAREARHRAWTGSVADWWVTAHHQGDQAETLLFRLLRGTGVEGASAMSQVVTPSDKPGRLRPLLGLPRSVLLEAAQAECMRWIEDESNTDTRFSRNFLRHQVLPLLRTRFPGADTALCRAAEHFGEASGMLEALAKIDLETCGEHPLRRDLFSRLDEARQANVLRHLLRQIDSPMPDRSRLNEALRQLASVDAGKALLLPLGQGVVHAYRDWLWLTPAPPRVPEHPVDWPDAAVLTWGEGQLTRTDAIGRGVRARLFEHGMVTVRTRWPGVEMRLQGRPAKTFKQLAQEAGIPPTDRDRLPIVCVDDQPVWMAGIGISEHACCLPGEAGVVVTWVRPNAYCPTLG